MTSTDTQYPPMPTPMEDEDIVGERLLPPIDVRAAEADARFRRFVMERPFVALGAAIAGGFLIGRVLSR